MPTVKLGRKEFHLEFDVDSEEIDASGCGVSVADCVAFAARMTTGEISRVKKLHLVSFFFVWLCFCAEFAFAFSSACVRANMSFAGRQPSRGRGSEGDCCRSATEQQRAVAAPCKMNFADGF